MSPALQADSLPFEPPEKPQTEKLVLKFIWKGKGTRTGQTIF